MRVFVLIPAAGLGRRMGAEINKQYLELAGRPILAHTLSLFESHPKVDRILVVSPAEEIPFCREQIVRRYGFAKVHQVVPGGAERQDSVRLGLEACDGGENDLVVIHDGVRPFCPSPLIAPLLEAAAGVGASLLGVPVKDTIKEVEEGMVKGSPDRSRLWQAQTPQVFRLGLIREAHRRALEEGFRGTDDASLVERLGLPVAMLEGSYRNIKITTPEDLEMARAFLVDGEGGAP